MDERTLNDLLECSVCLERLDTTSKVLPCQHTFCRKCLEVSYFKCLWMWIINADCNVFECGGVCVVDSCFGAHNYKYNITLLTMYLLTYVTGHCSQSHRIAMSRMPSTDRDQNRRPSTKRPVNENTRGHEKCLAQSNQLQWTTIGRYHSIVCYQWNEAAASK